MDVGSRIRDRRKALRLSQEDLARRAEVSLNLINKLERGVIVDPHYSTLVGIARALGTSVAELVGEPEPAGKAQAPPSPSFAEVSPGERRAEENIKRLHGQQRSLWNTVHRWETAGYELQLAEVSSILSDLEYLEAEGLFQRSELADPADAYEVRRDLELEMAHKAVQRLQEAAEPVLAARVREKEDEEAQRVRRGFKVIEGKTRRAA